MMMSEPGVGGSSFRSGIAFTGNGWGRFMAYCCQMQKYVVIRVS